MTRNGGMPRHLSIALRVLFLGLLAMLPFQNCGTDFNGESSNLFKDKNGSSDCLSELVDCGPNEEFLEITLDIANPTGVNLASPTSSAVVDIGGRCNTGNYPEHNITVKVIGPTGTLLFYADKYMACFQGRFHFGQLLTGGTSLQANAINTLEVEMVGINSGQADKNFLSTGLSRVDLSVQTP